MTLQLLDTALAASSKQPRMTESDETQTSERVLVIAGYDPSGGAGIDADRSTADALMGEVECVATAFTDQTSEAVRAVGARNAEIWADEVRDVWKQNGGFSVVKFGLLPGAEHVRAAARLIAEWRAERKVEVVVDPVIASSSGHTFLDEEGCRAVLRELLPRGVILTPNLEELARLTGHALDELASDVDLRAVAGRDLAGMGASTIVVKGGHGGEDPVCDLILAPGKRAAWRTQERVTTPTGEPTVRGTGCRFATALSIGLATGLELADSVELAGRHVASVIAAGAKSTSRASL